MIKNMDHNDKCIKPVVWILKIYVRKMWRIHDIYDSRAKAQRIASEFGIDTSITKWTVK
jgi:hypothetical protein